MLQTKTPQFDVLIDKILNELVPHSRICFDCKKEFFIEKEDIIFYKMFRVPPSDFCADCRRKQRLSFANYSNIYKRKCDFSGHDEMMISPVAPVMPWTTYDHESYQGDAWDPFSYGKSVDQRRPFFEQFLDLEKNIPQPGVRRGENSINCDFSFYGKDMKDCYYLFGGRKSEDIVYASSIYGSRHIMDSYFTKKVDTAYDSIRSIESYNIKYAYFSSNCLDCSFIFDCRNCQNCFGCVNLRNKNYCWFNEQLSKEEYQKRMSDLDLGSRKVVLENKEKFWMLVKSNPIRSSRIQQSQNVSGDDILSSNNCHKCFQIDGCDNLRHVSFSVINLKDSMDVTYAGGAEKLYFCQNTGTHSSNVKFSFAVKESLDCEYLMTCTNCKNCFGCIGLKNSSYCILNKQYEEGEYWKKLDEIKSEMLKRGEYGGFFPMSFAPVAYNSSFAHIIYPMTEEEAKSRGLFWQPDINTDTSNLKTIPASELPDNIKDATEEICNIAVIGEVSKKPFKITKRELDFYKQNNIPLPLDAPYQRILDRLKILNNFKTFQEKCFSCAKSIESSYRTSDGYKPYCEQCFQRDIL